MRKTFHGFALLAIIALTLAFSVFSSNGSPVAEENVLNSKSASVQGIGNRTITVPDDYPTLQEALNNANDGDTIILKIATFNGITINKKIVLSGEGSPAIFGSLSIKSDAVQITGVTVFDDLNIISSNDTVAIGNNILGKITLENSSACVIRENTGIVDMISLNNCYNVSIFSNSMMLGGVWLFNSSFNHIFDQSIRGSNFGICVGLNSSYNIFNSTTITIDSGEGLWVFGSSNVFYNIDLSVLGSGYLECVGPYTWNNTVNFGTVNMYELLGFVYTDAISPDTSCSYDDTWHISDFTIDLTVLDDKSGVLDTFYQINGGPVCSVNDKGQPAITSEGYNNILEYWSLDNAGNEEGHHTIDQIKLDKTPPIGSIKINNDDASTITSNVTLNLWASDTSSGISQMRFSNDGTNWTAWETYATSRTWNLTLDEATNIVYTQYKDAAGLLSQSYYDTIMLSNGQPPTTTVSLYGAEGENEWFTTNVNVTLSATDDISGVEETQYSFDNLTWNTYTTPLTITNQGTTLLYYRSTDKAGNSEAIKTQTIEIDKTAPVGSVVVDSNASFTFSREAILNLTAQDVVSGVDKIRCGNDGVWDTEPWEDFSETKNWTLSPGEGAKIVYYQIIDNAGLVSPTYSGTIVLDASAPTGSILINEGTPYTNSTAVTLQISANDSGSGVDSMRFSNDSNTWSEWEEFSASRNWIVEEGGGLKVIYAQFKDRAGYVSEVCVATTLLDTEAPVIRDVTKNPSISIQENESVRVTANVSDSGSGIRSVRLAYFTNKSLIGLELSMMLNLTSGFYEFTIPGQEANTMVRYRITVIDNANNTVTDDNAGQYHIYMVLPEFPTFLLVLPIVAAYSLLVTRMKRKHT